MALLHHRPLSRCDATTPGGSRDRTQSPTIVSAKREYSRSWLETFGSSRARNGTRRVWRRSDRRKTAILSLFRRSPGDVCETRTGWLGNQDSNLDKQSQSLLCYRYTIPQGISEQVQPLRGLSGVACGAGRVGRRRSNAPFYSLEPGLGKACATGARGVRFGPAPNVHEPGWPTTSPPNNPADGDCPPAFPSAS